mgnify:CR=1 FL=1
MGEMWFCSKTEIDDIPYYRKMIEDKGIEIFEERGTQFMTEKGLFRIVTEDKLTPKNNE